MQQAASDAVGGYDPAYITVLLDPPDFGVKTADFLDSNPAPVTTVGYQGDLTRSAVGPTTAGEELAHGARAAAYSSDMSQQRHSSNSSTCLYSWAACSNSGVT